MTRVYLTFYRSFYLFVLQKLLNVPVANTDTLAVCLHFIELQIKISLVDDQHDAQILFLCISFYLYLSTCFEHIVLIIRRDKLYQYSLW